LKRILLPAQAQRSRPGQRRRGRVGVPQSGSSVLKLSLAFKRFDRRRTPGPGDEVGRTQRQVSLMSRGGGSGCVGQPVTIAGERRIEGGWQGTASKSHHITRMSIAPQRCSIKQSRTHPALALLYPALNPLPNALPTSPSSPLASLNSSNDLVGKCPCVRNAGGR